MKRFVVVFLRLCIVLLLALPLLVPVVRREHSLTAPQTITVLVSYNTRRSIAFDGALEQKIKDRFGDMVSLEWKGYGAPDNHPVQDFEDLLNLSASNKGTTVIVGNEALWGQTAHKFNDALRGLQSSGNDRLWFVSEQALGGQPLSSVPAEYLAVSDVFMPKMSFLGEESAASIEIIGKLKPSSKISPELVLRSGDSLLAARRLELEADAHGIVHSMVSVPVLFVRASTQILTVSLNSPLAVAPLNSASTSVSVAHSKTTLLHIGVGPDWSLRSLRQKLKFWPNLDLLSYYILREANDDMSIPSSQLSLIEFPAEKLFGTELPNFHGIVAENFLFDQYLNPTDTQNLINYVKNGGRMVIQAGPLSFASRDSNITALSPCRNTPEFDFENTYRWETGTVKLASNLDLQGFLKHVSSRATAIKCDPKPDALVLAQTVDGQHPVLLAQPLEKGLVLTFMAGDWHTAFTQVEVKSEADRANRIEQANATDDLFQWMVEFLQRRQDSGLRPPDLAGPRIYDGDKFYALRSRGILRLENPLHFYSNDVEVAIGQASRLPLLEVDGIAFDNPLAPAGNWSNSPQKAEAAKPPRQLTLHLQFDDAATTVKRPGLWPVNSGTAKALENLPNPILYKGLPHLIEGSSVAVDGASPSDANQAKNTNNERQKQVTTENVPLLVAYPHLLALLLALLAFEQFLTRILWPARLPSPVLNSIQSSAPKSTSSAGTPKA